MTRVMPPITPHLTQYMRTHDLASVKALAEHLSLSRTTIHDLLRAKGRPSTETILRLAEALGLPSHEVFYLLIPDAPGSPVSVQVDPRATAQSRLQALTPHLGSVDDFLAARRADQDAGA